MKLALLALTAIAGAAGICDLCGTPAAAAATTAATTEASNVSVAALYTVTLHIEGMTCGGCTLATRKVLERLPGVAKAGVTYEHQRGSTGGPDARQGEPGTPSDVRHLQSSAVFRKHTEDRTRAWVPGTP